MSDSECFSVGKISHLSKISSMPLCKECLGCGGMVHIRKASCSCGHVFITKRRKSRLTARSDTRKHAMSSFRAIERHEKAAERRSLDKVDNTNVDWDRESTTYSISGANLPTWLGDQPDQPRKKTK